MIPAPSARRQGDGRYSIVYTGFANSAQLLHNALFQAVQGHLFIATITVIMEETIQKTQGW